MQPKRILLVNIYYFTFQYQNPVFINQIATTPK